MNTLDSFAEFGNPEHARFLRMVHICGHDWSTLKVEPPLTVSREEMECFVEAVSVAVAKLEEFV